MAKNKYSRRTPVLRPKPVIIAAAAAVSVLAGTIIWMALQNNTGNLIAGKRYEFNRHYPDSFYTPEAVDLTADYDRDGLINHDEIEMATNGRVPDTDGDGILDGYEVQYKADPLKADTDGDGLSDGVELLAGLDPLSKETDGTPDAERIFTRRLPFDEGYAIITGDAGIFAATVEKLSLFTISSNAGAFSFPYEVYCETPFESAEIHFVYSEGLIKAAGLKPGQVHIYRFEPKTKTFVKEGGTIDTAEREIYQPIDRNGVFIIGADYVTNDTVIDENTPLNIHLLIDNSGSMYPSVLNYKSEENDTEFKRLVFASNLVSKLDDNARVSVSSFTYGCKTLCGFTESKIEAINAINDIRSIGAGYDGTSVERAIMAALNSYTEDMQNERNMVILLTDGISTDKSGYTLEHITDIAQAKNVTIMTISLGDDIDRELLQALADRTGGSYFPISDADALEGLYSTVIATMENDIVDEDLDGTLDSYSLHDTGFRAEENGFTFRNFKLNNCPTVDFGMAMLARDWFMYGFEPAGGTPDSEYEYNFEKTTIDVKQPLSKVFLTSMSASYLSPENYLDFLSEGETLKVQSDIAKEAEDMGWIIYKEPIRENSSGWTQAEYLVPNYSMGRIRVKYGENDYQMIRAIAWYNTFRDTGKNFILTEESGLRYLKKILSSGEPVLMKMSWEESGKYYSRYTLLTALRRSVDSPNIFNLKTYDLDTGNDGKIVLTRTMKITGNGQFNGDYTYSANWDGMDVSLSFYLSEIQ